jgi:hypothetical protein
MPTIEIARHLHRFFPVLAQGPFEIEAATVAESVAALNRIAPGVADYIIDELGALRQHVNIFVGLEMVLDRQRLSDRLAVDDRVSVFQALSGG